VVTGDVFLDSLTIFSYFQDDLLVERQWRYGGTHARNTCEAWLIRLDAQRPALWPIFERTYGKANAARMWNTWRVYFMAQAELFGFAAGASWATLHLLWMKK
jgi:cyclopropane-fatty-acyl-phospholipid synthase